MTIASVVVPDTTSLHALPEGELLALAREIADARRRFDSAAAAVSGEIKRRSHPDLGSQGLAQRTGARTPEKLVQQLTGVTHSEARTLVRVGDVLSGSSPWLAAVATAVQNGTLPVAAAESISSGLGAPSAHVAADDLADAAARLVECSTSVTPERLATTARAVRDALDAEGVADREASLREQRYLKLISQANGLTRIVGLLAPEQAAIVVAAVDAVTSPRRGGPRFVDPADIERAERIVNDSRTTDQLAVDALVDMVTIATRADSGRVFGSKAPTVRMHVTLAEFEARKGAATIEGQSVAVSIETIERNMCATGYLPILFHAGQPLDVGPSQRLFTYRQQQALAARDGGCMWPGCDRPPSWCESHHIIEWRHEGPTDIENGILLCRHHHLLLHNNAWRITHDRGDYRLVPPVSVDAQQKPVRMGRQ